FPESIVVGPNRDRRDAAIAARRSGPGPYPGALIDDGDDGSHEYCEALLHALGQGAALDVPRALLRHLHDARVRPALVEALRTACEGNIAQVVGIAGGPGALDALREWRERIADDECTFLGTARSNDLGTILATVCEAELRLNPDELPAADALIRLFPHPAELVRRCAVSAAAAVCEGHLRTASIEQLRDRLETLVSGDDDHLFLIALPGLRHAPFELVVRRVEALALGTDAVLARWAISAICSCPYLVGQRNRILSLALENGPTLDSGVYIISWLAGGDGLEKGTTLLRQALAEASPSLRWQAIECLDRLPQPVAVELAKEAIADEPDSMLHDKLREIARARTGRS
ncbi:MAG: hypothetical protein OXR73_27785, partial [Myxococcales bacterium]|nr:hypothetical protein [Myxococcales bacterium]